MPEAREPYRGFLRRYAYLTGAIMAFSLALFLAVEAVELPLLTDPAPWLERGGVLAAVLGLALLVADVLLPVPASFVMVANGALFGVLTGTLLSLAGGVGAAAFGFYLGKSGERWLSRFVSREERVHAGELMERWGELAVVVTRPIPIFAETVAIVAGAAGMSLRRFAFAAFVGSLPAALLYALTGATAARFDSFVLIFTLVIVISGVFCLVGRRLRRDRKRGSREGQRATARGG